MQTLFQLLKWIYIQWYCCLPIKYDSQKVQLLYMKIIILRLNIKDKEFSMIISMHKVKHKWWRERWESVAFHLSGQRGTRDLAVFEALPLILPCTYLQSVHLCNNPQHTEWVYKLIKFKQNFYITVDILIHFKQFLKIQIIL